MHLKSSWHRLEPSHFSPRFWNNPAPARPSSPRRAGPASDSGRRRREAGRQREEQRARGSVQTEGLAERADESAAAKWADRGGRKGPGSRPPRQIGEKGERAQSVWKQGVLTSGSGWRGWPGWMDLRPHPTAARGGRASSCLAEAERRSVREAMPMGLTRMGQGHFGDTDVHLDMDNWKGATIFLPKAKLLEFDLCNAFWDSICFPGDTDLLCH